MQQARESAGKNITVTGCLKAGDGADSFMLSDLKWGKKDDKAVGTSGAPAAIGSATSLKLTGSPSGTKLSEHVGHTVEVSGTVSEKGASAPSAPADPASSRPSSASAPALDVKTVKMVSATCTP
jgi:hypothetical protein